MVEIQALPGRPWGGVARAALCLCAALVMSACGVSAARKDEAKGIYKLGISQLASGNAQGAYVKFNEALNINDEDMEIHNGLGYANILLGEYASAQKSFQRAVELDPDYSEAYKNLCYAYFLDKKYQEAVAACNRALQNKLYETPHKAYYNLARVYYRMKDYEASVRNFKLALKRDPNFYEAYYGLALTYNAQRQYGQAAEAMGLAIGLDPNIQGDKRKAEFVFRKFKEKTQDTTEIDQYLDILKY